MESKNKFMLRAIELSVKSANGTGGPFGCVVVKNNKIIAFAGIGDPENFFSLLNENKLNIIETIKFPDHHKYSEKELENLLNKMKKNDAILLTTEKDYFRISGIYKKNIKFLKIKVEIDNKKKFIDEIKKII